MSRRGIVAGCVYFFRKTNELVFGWPTGLAMSLELSYLAVPIGLIPERFHVVHHSHQFGMIAAGLLVARCLAPPEPAPLEPAPLEPAPLEPAEPADTTPPAAGAEPNFFLVGTARSGTTSLFNALASHPDIFCCPVKEPNHFAPDIVAPDAQARRQGAVIEAGLPVLLAPPRVAVTPDRRTYLGLFKGWAGQRAVGEASTSYLPSRLAASAIAACHPAARIVIVLRDPTARAYSDYLMQVQVGEKRGSFRAAIEAELGRIRDGVVPPSGIVFSGLYAEQIRRYFACFPRRQVLCLLAEDFATDPEGTLALVFRHLGVDPQAGRQVRLGWDNRSRVVRSAAINRVLFRSGCKALLLRCLPRPVRAALRRLFYTPSGPAAMPAEDHALLLSLYQDDIAETGRLIGRDLRHWAAE
jgi:Sulfotransferase family